MNITKEQMLERLEGWRRLLLQLASEEWEGNDGVAFDAIRSLIESSSHSGSKAEGEKEKKPKFDVATWNKLVKGIRPTGGVVGQSAPSPAPSPGPCANCRGTGIVYSDPDRKQLICGDCDGVGYVPAPSPGPPQIITLAPGQKAEDFTCVPPSAPLPAEVQKPTHLSTSVAEAMGELEEADEASYHAGNDRHEAALNVVRAALSQSTPVCRQKGDIPCGKEVEEAMAEMDALLEAQCHLCKVINPQHKDCTECLDMDGYRHGVAVIRAALSKPPVKVTREFIETHAMAVYRASDQHDAKVLMGHAFRELGIEVTP